MKKAKIYHCIMFNYCDVTYQADLYSRYRLTVSAMAKRFFQIVIDEGYNLSQITDVEFLIGGDSVLGCSDAVSLCRFFVPLGRQVHAVHGEHGAKSP
jgi:hypothetical protein